MPRRPRSPCRGGCGELLAKPGRCADCRTVYDREVRARSPRLSSDWPVIRKAYAEQHPMCERAGCGKPMHDVHHKIPRRPIREGDAPGTDDEENLESLCRSHHAVETRREMRARAKARAETRRTT